MRTPASSGMRYTHPRSGSVGPSAAGPGRLALLQERGEPLLGVLRREDQRELRLQVVERVVVGHDRLLVAEGREIAARAEDAAVRRRHDDAPRGGVVACLVEGADQ